MKVSINLHGQQLVVEAGESIDPSVVIAIVGEFVDAVNVDSVSDTVIGALRTSVERLEGLDDKSL